MVTHDGFVPSDSGPRLRQTRQKGIYLVSRFVYEWQHCGKGDVPCCKHVCRDAIETVDEVTAENGSKMQILPLLAGHGVCYSAHSLRQKNKHIEVGRPSCLYIKRNTRGIHRPLLAERLQRIEHPTTFLRQGIHRHASGRVHHQPLDARQFLRHNRHGTVGDGNDIEVGIQRNGTVTPAPTHTCHVEGRTDGTLKEGGYAPRAYQYCPICTRSHFRRSSFCGLRSMPLWPTAMMHTTPRSLGMPSKCFTVCSAERSSLL